MSDDVQKLEKSIEDAVGKKLNLWEGEYKEELKTIGEQGKHTSDKLEKMSTDIDKFLDVQNGMEKRLKSATSIRSMASGITEEGMKDIGDFLHGIRQVGQGAKNQFSTNDLKSNQDILSAFQTKAQFGDRDDSTGGLFIPPTIDSMLNTLLREFSTIRGLASTTTISGDIWKQNFLNQTNGAVRRRNITNFSNPTKTDSFGQTTIMVADLYSILSFTDNLVMDSAFNIVSELMSRAAEDFDITESAEFVNGIGGSEEMKGILTYDDGTGFDKVERIQSGTTLKIDFDDIFNLIYAIKTGRQQNMALYGHRLTHRVLRKLKDSENRPLWEFSQQAGQPSTIAGVPVLEMPELVAPDVTDSYVQGDEPIIAGNINGAYQIVDNMGIVTTRDELTSYPDILFKMKKRSGGGIKNGEFIKVLQIS